MTNIWEQHLQLVKKQYPDNDWDGWTIEMEGIIIDEIECTSYDFYTNYNKLVNDEGYFEDSAIEETMNKFVINSKPPKGYMFVRLVKDVETPILLLVKL